MNGVNGDSLTKTNAVISDLRDSKAIVTDTWGITIGLDKARRTSESHREDYGAIVLVGADGDDTVKYIVSQWCRQHKLSLLEVDCTDIKLKDNRDDNEDMVIPGQIIKWPKSMIEGLEDASTVLFLEGYDKADPTIRRELHKLAIKHEVFSPYEKYDRRKFENLILTVAMADEPILNYCADDFAGLNQVFVSQLAFTPSCMNQSDAKEVLTPDECINRMLRHVGSDGMLYIPVWPHGTGTEYSSTSFYACEMNKDSIRNDDGNAQREFDRFMKAFRSIAERYALGKDSSPEFKPFEAINQFDMDIINNIGVRLNCQDEYGYCMIMPEDELAIAEGCQVSEDEIAMYDRYRKAIYEEVENMLPGKVCAYGSIIRANRICRLLSMHAQDDVIQNEAVLFAQALVLCEYCESMKVIELTV